MSLWAIVPVKPLRRGKSRLSEILSEDERAHLNHQLFVHTIDILKQVEAITDILVVSRDSDVLTEARDLKVRTVTENGTPELNAALRRATLFSKVFSTEGVNRPCGFTADDARGRDRLPECTDGTALYRYRPGSTQAGLKFAIYQAR